MGIGNLGNNVLLTVLFDQSASSPGRVHRRSKLPRIGGRIKDLDGAEGVPGVTATDDPKLALEACHGSLRTA